MRRESPARYHIYPGDVEYNGYSYLGPAIVSGDPVGLNYASLPEAQKALRWLHTDPTKRDWVIYDFLTGKRILG